MDFVTVLLIVSFFVCVIILAVDHHIIIKRETIRKHQFAFRDSLAKAISYFGMYGIPYDIRYSVNKGEYDNYPHLKSRYILASRLLIEYYTLVTEHNLETDSSLIADYVATCEAIYKEKIYLDEQADRVSKNIAEPQVQEIATRMSILKDIPK